MGPSMPPSSLSLNTALWVPVTASSACMGSFHTFRVLQLSELTARKRNGVLARRMTLSELAAQRAACPIGGVAWPGKGLIGRQRAASLKCTSSLSEGAACLKHLRELTAGDLERCQCAQQAGWLGMGLDGEARAPPDLFLFCVAAAVLRRRQRVLAECQGQDDAMRLFNTARAPSPVACTAWFGMLCEAAHAHQAVERVLTVQFNVLSACASLVSVCCAPVMCGRVLLR